MTDTEGKALWARFKAAEPDPLTLAAYAEGRLDPAEAAAVERFLALDPEAAADVAAARAALAPMDEAAAGRVAARALPLVSARIIPFPVRVRRVAEAMAIAASLVLVAYAGFELGSQSEALAEEALVDVLDGFGPAPLLLGEFEA
jgi:anti-sigma factor RsiW